MCTASLGQCLHCYCVVVALAFVIADVYGVLLIAFEAFHYIEDSSPFLEESQEIELGGWRAALRLHQLSQMNEIQQRLSMQAFDSLKRLDVFIASRFVCFF